MTDGERDDRARPASDSESTAEQLGHQAMGPDMARVLAHLAEQPAPRDVLPAVSEPTWEDVQAVLAPAGDGASDRSGEAAGAPVASAFVTPQAFYAEIMQRPDVRRLLRALDE